MRTSPGFRVAVLILAAALTPIDHASGQSSTELMKQFSGMWQLASWDNHLEDGTTRPDPRSDGYLMYTETGRMCYFGTDPSRIQWASPGSPTPAEALNGILGMGGYCARVEINAEERFVLHHVEFAMVPNYSGITRRRFFEFRGPDELVLTVDPVELAPPLVGQTLVWRRVG